MTRPLNVVIVNEGLAYPPTAGNRIRTSSLMLRLARRHNITYICRRGDEQETREMVEFLRDRGIASVVAGKAPAPKSGMLFAARLARNLLSPLPYSVTLHNCAAVRRAVREHAAAHPVDLWQFEWHGYADVLNGSGTAPRVLMAHDVISTLWERHYQTEEHPLRRWYIGRQLHKFIRFEGDVLRRADQVVAVSHHDAATIRERYAIGAVEVVENGIDRTQFEGIDGERDPNRILFLGALDSLPNRDAAMLLLERIFPAVLARAPAARLWVVGRNPPDAVRKKASETPGVEVCANVPDVRPFLARSGVMVVPLRIGSGSRLKILEALASGLPVVSSSVGTEGLCLAAGHDLCVADGEEAIAQRLAECIRAPERARAMAENGRRKVLERYDWDVLAERLEAVWMKCIRSAAHRQRANEVART